MLSFSCEPSPEEINDEWFNYYNNTDSAIMDKLSEIIKKKGNYPSKEFCTNEDQLNHESRTGYKADGTPGTNFTPQYWSKIKFFPFGKGDWYKGVKQTPWHSIKYSKRFSINWYLRLTPSNLTTGKTWKTYSHDNEYILYKIDGGGKIEQEPISFIIENFTNAEKQKFYACVDSIRNEFMAKNMYIINKHGNFEKDEKSWKDGKRHGKWKEWYQYSSNENNYILNSEGNYKDGKKDGLFTSWVVTDDEFGCFIGLKIKSDDILNYKVLKTIEKISNTLNPNDNLFSIIDENFYQGEDGFLVIKQMFPDLNRLKLTEIEKQQIINHIQQRASIRNVFLSLENSYTTVLINTNTIFPEKIERIKKSVEQHETDDIEIDIYIPSIIKLKGDIRSPDVLGFIEEIEQFLHNNYDVEYSLSFSDHIKDLHCVVMDNDPKYRIIPDSKMKIKNLITMYSMSSNPNYFSHLVNTNYSETNILFYLPDKSELEKSKMVLELMKFIYELTLIEKFNIITYPKKYEYF